MNKKVIALQETSALYRYADVQFPEGTLLEIHRRLKWSLEGQREGRVPTFLP